MARIAYSDLFLNFTPSATAGKPIQSEIAALITNYYKQMYGIAYGLGNYNGTDSDTSDPQVIIRAEEVVGDVIAEISTKVQQWHDSGIGSDGQVIQMPNFDISPELEKKLKRYIGKSYDRVENIRVWGTEWDEEELI